MLQTPNIFEYATSELSQDAFLCYLLSFAKKDYEHKAKEEHRLARLLLEKLGVNECVEEIKRQKNYIDVLILTSRYVIILEDKTYTKEHNQLDGYIDKIKKDYNKEVKVLYFKTGYTDIKEKEKLKDKAEIFDIEKIVNFMSTYSGNNIIIKMWNMHIQKIYNQIKLAEDKCSDIKDFKSYYDMGDVLQQDVCLDKLTQIFMHDFKDVCWYRSGQGRTPHICFNDTYIDCSKTCKIHFGIYVMFRSKPQIVVKQHLYTADEHRIRIKEYNKYKTESVELVNTKQKLYQAINTSVWKKKNEDKDGLIILSKETDNIKNCVNDIKNLQTILASCF